MYSFRLTATNINTAEDLNFIQFAIKRQPKITAFARKRKRECVCVWGGGGEESKDGNKGRVGELNCTVKAGNKTKFKLSMNKKGIRKCHHSKHGAVS